jgi:hypothetical protein
VPISGYTGIKIGKQEIEMKIKPYKDVASYRTGGLSGLTKKDIDRILGFKPNVLDDQDKVKYSWGFRVNSKTCAVWDYKGSYKHKEWSVFGPSDLLEALFGDHFYSSR